MLVGPFAHPSPDAATRFRDGARGTRPAAAVYPEMGTGPAGGAARMEIETVTVGQDGGERASRLTAIRPNNP
ncbi:hypothetical protein Adi01nite_22100 [Amorphoplanes digitatis]|nr:hypothetical protein Adi01nite_22100 [Actinoplanes digitatis]